MQSYDVKQDKKCASVNNKSADKSKDTGDPTMYMVSQLRNGTGMGGTSALGYKRSVDCWRCNSTGHIAKNCPQRKLLVCFHCKKEEYMIKDYSIKEARMNLIAVVKIISVHSDVKNGEVVGVQLRC